MQNIKEYLRQTPFLPPSFQVLPPLLLLLDDPGSSVEDLVELIRVDAGLTSDVLKVCNSALHSGVQRVETLRDAVLRLGFGEVYRILLAVVTSPVLARPEIAYGTSRADLWNHSLAAGLATQHLASTISLPGEVAFTAGLLHDVGKVLLSQAAPAEYRQIIDQASHPGQELRELERAALGLDHAEAGAELLDHWQLPPSIVGAVRWHHDPASSPSRSSLEACACLGNCLAYRIGQGQGFPHYAACPPDDLLELAGTTLEKLHEDEQPLKKAFDELQAAFQ